MKTDSNQLTPGSIWQHSRYEHWAGKQHYHKMTRIPSSQMNSTTVGKDHWQGRPQGSDRWFRQPLHSIFYGREAPLMEQDMPILLVRRRYPSSMGWTGPGGDRDLPRPRHTDLAGEEAPMEHVRDEHGDCTAIYLPRPMIGNNGKTYDWKQLTGKTERPKQERRRKGNIHTEKLGAIYPIYMLVSVQPAWVSVDLVSA